MPHASRQLPPAARRLAAAGGFTLVELMISIALVLVLVIGVNQVFRIATQSVGAGQALGDQSRDNRAVQTVLFNDLSQSVIRSSEAPLLLIKGGWVSAFLDRNDELSDRDYAQLAGGGTQDQVDATMRTIDLDGDNMEGGVGEVFARNMQSNRVFRTDQLAFFTRHLYPRQTANEGAYTAQMTANEAFVWYGHLKQPPPYDPTATYLQESQNHRLLSWRPTNPTTGQQDKTGSLVPLNANTNPNNFYARSWGLGRVAMLLAQPLTTPPASAGQIQDKAGTPQSFYGRIPGAPVTSLAPLAANSIAFRVQPSQAEAQNLAEHCRYDLAGTTIDGFRTILRNALLSPTPPPAWWDDGNPNLGYRRHGYPFPTSPLSSHGVARTVPWLVGGCTNFMVEYAGDYVTQDAAGVVTSNYLAAPTDGLLDFILIGGARHTRWYGMPRDTNSGTAGNVGRPDGKIDAADVVPLETFLAIDLPHEHQQFIDTAPNNFAFTDVRAEYVAAWQPNGTYLPVGTPDVPKPKLLRITMTIDDPSGRLPEGQTYEYVIELPG